MNWYENLTVVGWYFLILKTSLLVGKFFRIHSMILDPLQGESSVRLRRLEQFHKRKFNSISMCASNYLNISSVELPVINNRNRNIHLIACELTILNKTWKYAHIYIDICGHDLYSTRMKWKLSCFNYQYLVIS